MCAKANMAIWHRKFLSAPATSPKAENKKAKAIILLQYMKAAKERNATGNANLKGMAIGMKYITDRNRKRKSAYIGFDEYTSCGKGAFLLNSFMFFH